MSYAIQPPVAAPPAPAVAPGPRRPVPVTLASLVLTLMAVVGLAYAVATIATTPGTVDRFRAAAAGAAGTDVDNYVSVVWIGAAIGTVLAVILVALFVVLAIGLRRGSNAARIATWAVCALGLLAGCGSLVTVLTQRDGSGDPESLGAALSGAYPNSWIGLNLGLAVAQMAGYLTVALLLVAARGAWFGHGPAAPRPPHPGWGPPTATGFGAGFGAASGAGFGYGAPYGGPQQPPGYPTTDDQAYRPGAAPWPSQTGPLTGGAPAQPFQQQGQPVQQDGQADRSLQQQDRYAEPPFRQQGQSHDPTSQQRNQPSQQQAGQPGQWGQAVEQHGQPFQQQAGQPGQWGQAVEQHGQPFQQQPGQWDQPSQQHDQQQPGKSGRLSPWDQSG